MASATCSCLGVGGALLAVTSSLALIAAPSRPASQSTDERSVVGARLDAAAARWVDETLAGMTVDQKVGQLIVPELYSTYTSTESDAFDRLATLVRNYHVGGLHVFGGREPVPRVLLNPGYGRAVLGDPEAAASLLDRLQAIATIPLLNTGDFEAGVGFRMAGATAFPRAMAFGAARDERLVYEAGRVTGEEAKAIGVHVNFAPVADVNNNPRNPVINTRSFGEEPERVSALAAAYVRGARAAGVIPTLKHFPGHGDTDVDTHLGLATITHPRERLDRVEWVPFRAGLAAGAGAIMTAHIEVPTIEPEPGTPATFSRRIVTDVLRGEFGFDGLIYTDSMSMRAISDMVSPGQAAVRVIVAGGDVVLHSPDPAAAFEGIRQAVVSGAINVARVDRSVRRILEAKARVGLHRERRVDLAAVAAHVGGRTHWAVAEEVSRRSITLLRDQPRKGRGGSVPLSLSRDAEVLYLSVLDYTSGWGIAAPSRTFIPELRRRWPAVTAIELSDRTTAAELDLVRAAASRYDAIVASVFVRAASSSGRMDLSPALEELLRDLVSRTAQRGVPFVTVLFGNPYVATFLPELPTVILTYDFYDLAEASAVRALSGEAPISGRLPIALPGVAPLGHGLERRARAGGR